VVTHRQGHEIDVVVTRKRPGQSDAVLAIGEAKSTATPVGEAELDRLDHLRELLPANRTPEAPRLLLFSRNGFNRQLRVRSGARQDVNLIDLERLYTGD
jgi:uncharacterized protein